MEPTPTDEDILAAADRCASRSIDGTVTSRDIFWELHQGSWRGYKGGHKDRPISLLHISQVIRAAGYQVTGKRSKAYTTYKRP